MEKSKRKIIFKIIFLGGMGLLFLSKIQNLLVPKWYYPSEFLEGVTRTITGFYEEPSNSIDVIALGASGMHQGYSPLYVYDRYGITSYNLGTSGQPIQGSFYLLKEALKTQKPQVVMIDALSLFLEDTGENSWRFIIDNMPLSLNKIQFAHEASLYDQNMDFWGMIFPTYRYHGRWEEISDIDWTDSMRNKSYYTKGYFLHSFQNPSHTSVEEMNNWNEKRKENTKKITEKYINGQYYRTEDKSDGEINIPQVNLKWLFKIKKLCEENNINLLVVRIPENTFYNGWTLMQYQKVRDMCLKYDITYLDLMYDVDVNIDWDTDTSDYGLHLNILGAQKVSEYLGEYLVSYYGISKKNVEKWNSDLSLYIKIKNLALLQLEDDFTEYIVELKKMYLDKNIFIVAKDDFFYGLSEDDKIVLKGLGLQFDYVDAYRKAYLAVVEGGEVKYESLSDEKLVYEDVTSNGHKYNLLSSGWLEGADAQIQIDDVQYAVNSRGLNIVVYDDDLDIVLDSVCFDTHAERHARLHDGRSSLNLKEYEYLLTFT